ncbi:MAG: hypothetical protein COC19_05485 [SAR86 cluster bacterium]|uniref:ABC3 transporter permease protein domain-containing protein n=1 Tax=SAR86 cluster bacterium TaxID=2030880 RepID=A0A2A4MKV4_9GAMM|nr:MAG: hypothetical protein COC19_05485 [SAR86 cluster bacterium]
MAHFFTISLRRLAKDRFYTAISILSLALGISCALIISLYIISELSFDHHHKNHQRIYRVTTEFSGFKIVNSGYEIGPLLAAQNPQFENYVRIREAYESEFEYLEVSKNWEDIYLADANVFDVFTFDILQGDVSTAFADPFSMAVSESFAEYYFPKQDPMGKTLDTAEYAFKITLVYKDFPENVTRNFKALLPFDLLEIYNRESRLSSNERYMTPPSYTYILAPPTFDADIIVEASASIVEKTIGQELANQSFELKHSLLALDALHFSQSDLGTTGKRGDITSIYSFSAVAIILLLTACINYINLATARISVRSQEISLRKILGANRGLLIAQFLVESFLVTGCGFLIAMGISISLLKLNIIEEFTGKSELVELLLQPMLLLVVVLGGLIISLLTGIYPAYMLVRQSMMQGIKPIRIGWRRFFTLRQTLVFIQLAVSVAIIACVVIMNTQLRYMENSYLGFKKDNQLVVRLQGADLISDLPAIRNELLRHEDILAVSNMLRAPGSGFSVRIGQVESNSGEKISKSYNSLAIGEYFFETLQVELIQGRDRRGELQNPEAQPVWVNEAFVKDMQWELPIGKAIGRDEVVGVTRDFHFTPMHEPITPLVLTQFTGEDYQGLSEDRRRSASTDMIVTVSGENLFETSNHIDAVLAQFTTQVLPEKRSMSTIWNDAYSEDEKSLQLIAGFAVISVVISLLGLAGLASFTAQEKTKEIAIRKILGASVGEILHLLARSLLLLLLLVIIPAVLLSYLAASSWLERFSYHAGITATPFIVAVAIVAVVSVGNLLLHVYKAANANPTENLRYE